MWSEDFDLTSVGDPTKNPLKHMRKVRCERFEPQIDWRCSGEDTGTSTRSRANNSTRA